MSGTTNINDYDALDVVCLCHAALAQDSPEVPTFYINQILNLMFGYLSADQLRKSKSILLRKIICLMSKSN